MDANEFDLDFDFEKEYGFDPPAEEDAPQVDEDFDLRAILESDFSDSEYTADFDYGPEPEVELPEEEPESAPEPMFESQPEAEDFPLDDGLNFDSDPDPVPQPEPEEEKPVRRQRPERRQPSADEQPDSGEGKPRRKPQSPMRRFKNEQLPKIIAGVTALLMLIFVIGSISRAIANHRNEKDSQVDASNEAKTKAQLEKEQVDAVLKEAEELATGYDYDGAVAKLESFKSTFTGDIAKYTDIDARLSSYKQAQSQLVAHNDPGAVANLSFNVLIADPSRAFTNASLGGKYNMNFVTIDEFEKILQQLYDNNYVLVDMDSFITETVNGDNVTYSSKTLYLPDGKNPIMITETLANYFNYMIDGDEDGVADKNGAGFASRLVLDSTGAIKAEMVNSAGETVVGDYDLVPILEKFIEEHPDFSYQGARATIAVTGSEGVFGYRINKSVIESKGQEYYDEQVAGAKKIANALREAGYEIACNTYENLDYGKKSASEIQVDIASWNAEIVPVIGAVDTLVYARFSDINSTGAYSGNKYNVLQDAGFRYFIGNGSKPSATVSSEYVHQNRILVLGTYMAHASSMYTSYFDAKAVLNSQRGDVPQS